MSNLQPTETPTSLIEENYGISYPYPGETPTRKASTLEEFYQLVNSEFAYELYNKFERKKVQYLEYNADWYDEDSKPFSKELFDKIEEFLFFFYTKQIEHGIILNIPKFLPVPDGSINLLWRFKNKLDLSMNIYEKDDLVYISGIVPPKEFFTLEKEFNKAIEVVITWLISVIQ